MIRLAYHIKRPRPVVKMTRKEVLVRDDEEDVPVDVPDDLALLVGQLLDRLYRVLGEFPQKLERRAVLPQAVEHEAGVGHFHLKGVGTGGDVVAHGDSLHLPGEEGWRPRPEMATTRCPGRRWR